LCHPVIERWDGTKWRTVPGPSPPGGADLYAVAARTANDAWAVGSANYDRETLIEHWDGTGWSRVPSPNPSGIVILLEGIAVLSPTNAWAVGISSHLTTGGADIRTLIEHWNGASWKIVPSPNPTGESFLHGVSAAASSDVWAVGEAWKEQAQTGATLVEHWDGATWTVVPSPNPETGKYVFDDLQSVSALSADDAWAVGTVNSNTPIIEHWDGNAWSAEEQGDTEELYGVTAVSPTDVWAVGDYNDPYRTLVEHWDGSGWSHIDSPNPASSKPVLTAVSATSATNAWAAGWSWPPTSGASISPIIEHWDGISWRVTLGERPPTVTSVSPNSGPAAGGTAVTIGGTGFVSGAKVSVGGIPATKVVVKSASTITATTPASPTGGQGTADVVVTTSGGSSPLTSSDRFTYQGTPGCATPHVVMVSGFVVAQAAGCFAANGTSYTTSGPVRVNGVDFFPKSGTLVTLSPVHGTLDATNATIRVQSGSSSAALYSGPISINYSSLNYQLPLGTGTSLFGLSIPLAQLPMRIPEAGQSEGTVKVLLPELLGQGASATGSVTLASDGVKSIKVEARELKVGGKLALNEFSVEYEPQENAWTGAGKIVLPFGHNLEIGVTATIANGDLTKLGGSVGGLHFPIGEGVFLNSLGVEIGGDPFTVKGTAEITAGPEFDGKSAVSVEGTLELKFGSPFEVDLAGTVKVITFEIAQASAKFLTSGQFSLQGSLSVSLPGASLGAGINGWIDGTRAFNLAGTGDLSIFGAHIGAQAVLSSVGMAACGHIQFLFASADVGVGYRWGGNVDIMGSSCDIGPYSAQLQHVFRAGPTTFTVPNGLRAITLAIAGDSGVPDVVIAGPGGERVRTNSKGVLNKGHYFVVLDTADHVADVAIAGPTSGTWTITPKGGSPAVASVRMARSLPTPTVTASVTDAAGLARILHWSVKPAPPKGQSITFVEQGGVTDRVITTTTEAAGKIEFTPAPGVGGTRTIRAVVMQRGLVRDTIDAATYKAPALSLLSVASVPHGGSGTVTSKPPGIRCGPVAHACRAEFRTGTKVTLVATPVPGSKLYQWGTGACTGTGNCALVLRQSTSQVADFSTARRPPAPTVSAPTARFQAHPSFRVAWASSHPARIASYDVQWRKISSSGIAGPWTWWRVKVPVRSAVFRAGPGFTYCFAARARDRFDNVSAWSAPRCTAVPIDDRNLTPVSGRWIRGIGSSFYLRTTMEATGKGSILQRTGLHARRLALVATTGPGMGTVEIIWNGRVIETVRLAAPTTSYDRVLVTPAFHFTQTGTVKLKVVSAGKVVQIDGLGWSAT